MGSDFLFIKPSFLRGIARVVDLFGNLNEYNTSRSGEEADALALRSDWQMVGRDLAGAFDTYRVHRDEGQLSLFDGDAG